MCLIILLAFGGYVFYTGWTQFKVPSGSVGIVVSKTSGVNLNPVTHDKFSWAWEFLLPTNAKVVSFSPKTENFQKSVSGLLPSGKEYAKVFNGGADFSFAFDFSIDAKASVENICDLLKSGDIQNQEDLDKLLNRAAENFANLAAQKILSAALSPSGADFVRHEEGSDPAAVVYDAICAAKARGIDVVIVDTAGRLHNKQNLMNELSKMRRVISRELPDADVETLMVLDATTGQNGLIQAEQFLETAGLTGIVLTKLDGTAKGGIVFAIAKKLGLPVKFVGVGEQMDDLIPFDPKTFTEALFK